MTDRVGVIGAGLIGGGMARSLLRAGRPVAVWGRRPETVASMTKHGAREAASAADLVAGCDVLLTCVSDGPAVEAVAQVALPALRRDMLWIDATTSDPSVTRRLAPLVAARGATLVDAPVTGGPPQAEAGELTSMVGSPDEAWDRVRGVVGDYSKTVLRFGDTGAGHTAKLLNNVVSQGTMVLLAEAYGLARRHGVDWATLYDAMMGGAARSGTLEKAVGPALEGDFDGARFSIANAAKDLRYAAALLGEDDRDWVVHAVHAKLRRAVEDGRGDQFVSRQLEP
jgi:3-hydroxyisobutyrate dehydrogenase-like beta-hydroxyacid dehydrogenase